MEFLVLQDKLESVQQIGPKTYAQYDEDRVFILISSVFTWALTKPIDPVIYHYYTLLGQ